MLRLFVMRGTWYVVHGMGYVVPVTMVCYAWYVVRGTWYVVSGGLECVFITLYREGATSTMPPGHRKNCNDFYHPAPVTNMEDLEKGQHQFWIQVGLKRIPEYPIRDCTEAFYHLRKTVGHPINIFSRWYH